MNTSLEGLSLHVADVERSIAFYARIPGAEANRHSCLCRDNKNPKAQWRPAVHRKTAPASVAAIRARCRPIDPARVRRFRELADPEPDQ